MDRMTIINEFLQSIDPELSAVEGNEFEYEYATSQITVSFGDDPRGAYFMAHLYKTFRPCIHLPLFIWSILHEVGHHETANEACCDSDDNELLERGLAAILPDLDIASDLYFNLTDERYATEWAVDYAEQNQKKVLEFTKKIAETY